MRIAANGGAVEADDSGKLVGRGAYVCREKACVDAAFEKQRLQRTLKMKIEQEQMNRLRLQLQERIKEVKE